MNIVRQFLPCIFQSECKLKPPTADEYFQMGEIHTYWFLIVAIVLAITVGRLGTLLREQIEKAGIDQKIRTIKLKKLKPNKLS